MLLLAHDVPLPFVRGQVSDLQSLLCATKLKINPRTTLAGFFNLSCHLGESMLFISQQGIFNKRCQPALSSVCRTVTANTGQMIKQEANTQKASKFYQSDQLVTQLLKAPNQLAPSPFQSQLGSLFSEAEFSKLA